MVSAFRYRMLAAVSVVLFIVGLSPIPAQAVSSPSDASTCVKLNRVWVHVEWDGKYKGGCAEKYKTGKEALISAGFAVQDANGMIKTINSIPNPAGKQDWWSYWHKTPNSTGKYPAKWEMSNKGATAYQPIPGGIEGWRLLHSYSASAEAPTVDPIGKATVKTIPQFTVNPDSAKVEAGSNVVFTAKAIGIPAPQLNWYTSTDAKTWHKAAEGSAETFTISEVKTSQTGLKVKARATNLAGSTDSAIAILTVKDPSAKVSFPDPVLSNCVAKAAAVPAAQLTQGKVSAIKDLQCYGSKTVKVADLTGIDALSGVKSLNFNTNAIKDLTPLAGMKQLTKLWLNGNNITSIASLSNLVNVTELMIAKNRISDLSPVAKMSKLTELYIDHNQISDLSALSDKKQLTRLVANKNQIVSLAPLENLSSLKKIFLMQNKIVDVTPLKNLTNLSDLKLAYNKITDVSALSLLTKLNSLELQSNSIADLSALQKLKSFKMLGFKARDQRIILPKTSPKTPVQLPKLKDRFGNSPRYLKANGPNANLVTMKNGIATFSAVNKYEIGFSDNENNKLGTEFSGILVQDVVDPATANFDPPKAAALWLYNQTIDGAMPGLSLKDRRDWGSTIDALFALEAAGAPAKHIDKVGKAIESHVRDYTTYDLDGEPGVIIAGATGKVLVAASMLGKDVNNFGGLDFRARSLATIGADGVPGQVSDIGRMNNANLFGQALVMIGLARTGDLPPETVNFLVTQQCKAGYFRIFYTDGETCDAAAGSPDRDATAMGIMALRAAKAKGIKTADAPLAKAVSWLVADQHKNGSFVGSKWTPKENTNSTGLAAASLVGIQDQAMKKAQDWVKTLQLKPTSAGASQAEVGAIAYDTDTYNDAVKNGLSADGKRQTWRYATAQATLALVPMTLYDLSPGQLAAKPDYDLSLSVKTAEVGEKITVTGRGFRPGETIDIILRSNPVKLATARANDNGEFVVTGTVPKVESGKHQLIATGKDSTVKLTAMLSVHNDLPVFPVDPTPVKPTPVKPTPVKPTPVKPTPVKPTPVKPTPVKPAPANHLAPSSSLPATGADSDISMGLIVLFGLAAIGLVSLIKNQKR